MPKFIKLVGGVFTEESTVNTSAGAADAGKVPALDSNGLLNIDMMPNGLSPETIVLAASENLAAGDFVNIWNDSGTIKARKADASGGVAKKADGFVLAAVTSGQNATIYYGNRNTQKTGLTAGSLQYLSGTVPGATTETPPSTAAYIVQRLGKSYSTTAMLVNIEEPVVLS